MTKCRASWPGGDCNNSVWSRGLCSGHYGQQYKGKSFSALRYFRPKKLSRKEIAQWCVDISRVDNECLLWPRGTKSHDSYGVVRLYGRQEMVHRLVYDQLVEPLIVGEVVHHKCRRKRCINPDHLQAVTPAANTAEGLEVRQLRRRITELEKQLDER